MKTTSLILLVAGSSTRFNYHTKKQFILIDNKPLFIHTLSNIIKFNFDRIIIVAKENEIENVKEYINNFFGNNNIEYVAGGSERYYSVYNAMKYLKNNKPTDYVFIHDGVRPNVNYDEMNSLYKVLEDKDAAILGIKMADTVKKVDANNRIIETINRDNLYRAVTPQAFNFQKYYEAIDKYINENNDKKATDDAQIYSLYSGDVYIVSCSSKNIKLTEYSDLNILYSQM